MTSTPLPGFWHFKLKFGTACLLLSLMTLTWPANGTTSQTNFFIDQTILDWARLNHGDSAVSRLKEWSHLISSTASSSQTSEADILESVNRFFNRVQFVEDSLLWGMEDYWATPVEFLSLNAGDCEDFSVAKYFTLLALGIPEEKIFLTYVKTLRLNQAHMVVTFHDQPGAEPLVLDNLDPIIRPASARSDLVPVFSFNGKGLWVSKMRGTAKLVGQPTRLTAWRELLSRIRIDYEAREPMQ